VPETLPVSRRQFVVEIDGKIRQAGDPAMAPGRPRIAPGEAMPDTRTASKRGRRHRGAE
jgi:hypothetical protein